MQTVRSKGSIDASIDRLGSIITGGPNAWNAMIKACIMLVMASAVCICQPSFSIPKIVHN